MEPRYLTKSRFKLGLECPTKLYYTKKEEYYDAKPEDEFLQALADGGFQVGELAKLYYPGGINIDELNYEVALARTAELLRLPDVTIYEAAFRYENLFVRTDLLVKRGSAVELIEVKAKSFDPAESFLNKNGFIVSKWKPYLYDATFQKYVVQNAYPRFDLSTFLLLVDKTRATSVDGLNQKFFVFKKDGRKQVKVNGPIAEAALEDKILIAKNIDSIIQQIYEGTDTAEKEPLSFVQKVEFFSENYSGDQKIDGSLGTGCKTCEFRLDTEEAGKQSGFHECWRKMAGFTAADFLKPMVLDIWNYRKRGELIEQGIFLQENVDPESFQPIPAKNGPGLSQKERQALQVKKSREKDPSHYIDTDGLTELQADWKFPYHFIDFETTAIAIPFNRGRRPYEAIAFQFSHHTLTADGVIEHKGQWLNTEPGYFPNFDFVRALRKELFGDDGTIFRYATHENTILNAIYRQLLDSGEPDRDALCQWIQTISHSKNDSVEKWEGARDMVDLKEVIQKFYYHPLTRGSISIKDVMPAILGSCPYLQEKYSPPIYGGQIKSLNFDNWSWVQYDPASGRVIDPYQLLPPVFDGADVLAMEALLDPDSDVADGGAALSAYAKMQFTEMSAAEREMVKMALLKYCELDTFAMVLVWEGLAHWMQANR